LELVGGLPHEAGAANDIGFIVAIEVIESAKNGEIITVLGGGSKSTGDGEVVAVTQVARECGHHHATDEPAISGLIENGDGHPDLMKSGFGEEIWSAGAELIPAVGQHWDDVGITDTKRGKRGAKGKFIRDHIAAESVEVRGEEVSVADLSKGKAGAIAITG